MLGKCDSVSSILWLEEEYANNTINSGGFTLRDAPGKAAGSGGR